MGHSQADKAASHERIVRLAAARVRELGTHALGVAELMQEAGLTHGGFYRHFTSREELVVASIERALHDGAKGAFEAESAQRLTPQGLLFALIDWYLSCGHRDGLASSCAVTSLASDVARGPASARAAYTRQLGAYLELFVRLQPPQRPLPERRAQAIAAWASMVGALSMARAVDDEALSQELLAASAAAVKARLV